MLTEDEVVTLTRDLWRAHVDERVRLDRIYEYTRGLRGIPEVPEGASDELQELAKLSVKNVLSLVVDSFAPHLSVVGYRAASARENAPAWSLWQAQRMDARQAEVHRAALTYGASYVVVRPGEEGASLRPRSPRQVLAVYEDPQMDAWPVYALETWVDYTTGKARRRGVLIDDEAFYPVDLGELPRYRAEDVRKSEIARARRMPVQVEEPVEHRAEVCPVVRFVNARDAEDVIVGEVEPLINLQRAINNVNFDRLVTSRFGAFPQRYIIGWTSSRAEILKASMSRVWTFDDHPQDVSVGHLPAAQVAPYNELLNEMLEHVAMVAQISPAQVTGKMINLSAEALAAAEAAQQRKVMEKRDSFGESWEQVMRLGAALSGDLDTAGDDEAEVVWRDTEARSFGAVVDGITKLAAAGIPIDELVSQVPNLSQQQVQSIRERVAATGDIAEALRRLASPDVI